MELVRKGQIKIEVDRSSHHPLDAFIHIALGRTGIFFGYPSRMQFAKELDDSQWTTEEKLKLLLFESHLFVYQSHHNDAPFDSNQFLEELHHFYGHHSLSSIKKLMKFFMKETREEQQTKKNSKGSRTTKVSGEALKNRIKSGELPLN
jgi:hypothetical protein